MLASLSLIEADSAHWLIETELDKIGYGKRIQMLQVHHSLGLHAIVTANAEEEEVDISEMNMTSRDFHGS